MEFSRLRNLILLCATFTATSALNSYPILNHRSVANGQILRILPIGDSITFGFRSSSGNGYRQDLLNLLSGNNATYIGSQHSGNMTNNNSEGYSGETIAQIMTNLTQNGSLRQRPNLVLIMAGTNDIATNDSLAQAPARLGSLIDTVRTACPDAAIILSEITPNGVPGSEDLVQIFNSAIPALAAARTHVLTVNMSSFVPVSDLVDTLHPTDFGYQLMANGWFTGIEEAGEKGWIGPPVNVNETLTTAVSKLVATTTSTHVTTVSTTTASATSTSVMSAATPTMKAVSGAFRGFRTWGCSATFLVTGLTTLVDGL